MCLNVSWRGEIQVFWSFRLNLRKSAEIRRKGNAQAKTPIKYPKQYAEIPYQKHPYHTQKGKYTETPYQIPQANTPSKTSLGLKTIEKRLPSCKSLKIEEA